MLAMKLQHAGAAVGVPIPMPVAGITIPIPTQTSVTRPEKAPPRLPGRTAPRGPDSASDSRAPAGDAPPARPPEPD